MSKFITIIRPDFMQFCGDACKAAAFNHLLFRIAGKSKDQPKEEIQAGNILWYAKTEQITDEMSKAWGVCKVRKEVNALIKMGLIGRRVNPEWGADRTKHFSFGQEQCKVFQEFCEKHAICIVHIGLPPEVMHLIYSSNANDTSIKCICAIHQMELIEVSNANDEYIEAIPIDIHTIEDYKEESTNTLSSESDAPALIDFEEKLQKRITDKHKAVSSHSHDEYTKGQFDDRRYSGGHSLPMADLSRNERPVEAPLKEEANTAQRRILDDDEPTVKLAAVKKGQAHVDHPRTDTSILPVEPARIEMGDSDSSGNAIDDAIALLPATNGERDSSGADLAQPVAVHMEGQVTPKRLRKPPVTPDEQPTPKSDTREIQRRINEHRGYALEEEIEIIRERKAIKSWCNLHTIEDYEQVMLKLKSDPYWGKTENYYRIGGVTLAKETPKALAQKPDTAAKPAQPYELHEINQRKYEERKKQFLANGGTIGGMLKHG